MLGSSKMMPPALRFVESPGSPKVNLPWRSSQVLGPQGYHLPPWGWTAPASLESLEVCGVTVYAVIFSLIPLPAVLMCFGPCGVGLSTTNPERHQLQVGSWGMVGWYPWYPIY